MPGIFINASIPIAVSATSRLPNVLNTSATDLNVVLAASENVSADVPVTSLAVVSMVVTV